LKGLISIAKQESLYPEELHGCMCFAVHHANFPTTAHLPNRKNCSSREILVVDPAAIDPQNEMSIVAATDGFLSLKLPPKNLDF